MIHSERHFENADEPIVAGVVIIAVSIDTIRRRLEKTS